MNGSQDAAPKPVGLIGVGYQGHTLKDLVAQLKALRVTRAIDVRLTPLSREPGMSKTTLSTALGDVGIAYEHRRELGNPKADRAGFNGDDAQRGAVSLTAPLLSLHQSDHRVVGARTM